MSHGTGATVPSSWTASSTTVASREPRAASARMALIAGVCGLLANVAYVLAPLKCSAT